MFRFRWGVSIFTAMACPLWGGCTDDDHTTVEEIPSVISFLADYPDIYGEITVEAQDSSHTWVLSEEIESDCISVGSSGISYRARSSRGYVWEGAVTPSTDSCSSVTLDAETADVFFSVIVSFDPVDAPIEVTLQGERVGFLRESWQPDPLYELDEINCGSLRRYFLEAQRAGKAVVIPIEEGQDDLVIKMGSTTLWTQWSDGCIEWS